MFVVRYVALAALAIWLGGMILLLAQTTGTSVFAPFDVMAAVFGATIIACLFVMKFVGPPPQAFALRAVLAFLMTALAVYSGVYRNAAAWAMATSIALGSVLLAWYAKE